MSESALALEAIIVGDRVRKDMGDIASLAASIKAHGLLHPVVVKKDRTLVAGHRRIEAARRLGWNEIRVTVVDVEDLLTAERDENTERKDFTPTEAVAIGRLIEEKHKAKVEAQKPASARKAALIREEKAGRIDLSKWLDDLPEPLGSTRSVVARAVGMGATAYEKAKAVVAAAEADPTQFGDLPEKMDETRNISGTHNELKRRLGANGSNGKKPRHVVLRKLHYPKPNREMQRALDSLGGICICLKELPIKQLDESKTKAWAIALKKAASTITRVAREVERVKGN